MVPKGHCFDLSRRQHGFESRWGYEMGLTPFGRPRVAIQSQSALVGRAKAPAPDGAGAERR